MARGDHIFVRRSGYCHHGIDAGDGTVIHYAGGPGRKAEAVVRRTASSAFSRGKAVRVRSYAVCDSVEVVLGRARSRLGEARYHIAFNNCEHFATWCKTGVSASEQVHDATAVAGGTVGSGTAVVTALGGVSATGAVAGLSGSGIMSGLATIGGVVGGGAAAGIVVVGTAPGAAATAAMLRVLKDDPVLDRTEREARRVGRLATVAGATAACVGSVGAVAAGGAVTGLSAAGITSGLAAVGAIAGGGMAAGVVVVTAAPALAAAGVGYAAYRLAKLVLRRGKARSVASGADARGPPRTSRGPRAGGGRRLGEGCEGDWHGVLPRGDRGMTRFNQCPNCGRVPSWGVYFPVYECGGCRTCYCQDCGGARCPDCGGNRRKRVGDCWGPRR